MLAAADVDFVDPAQTYYAFGYMVHYAVNRGLYSYGPGGDRRPRPDIAAGAPRISADGRTVTVRIKAGIRYAPPVGREVTAADVKYAFERAFSAHVASPYAALYFGDIAGVPAKPGAIVDIPGIQAPDDHTIVFRLTKPSALLLTQALAMPISTPVPEEYAKRFDARTPSTYDRHVAFTGPYMYRNDGSGRLVGHTPGKVIELVRNPSWDRRTDYRPAYLDSITIQEGNRDAVSAARRVLTGDGLVLGDTSAPAPVVKQALAHQRGQIAFVPGGAYRYVAINSTIEPFDNLNVRRAVVAAADRRALQLSRGGDAAGRLATHFLPLGFPGYHEAGGARGTGADFLANPRGDMTVAKRYMLAAKREDPGLPIDAAGRWTGDEPLLMVAADADPGRRPARLRRTSSRSSASRSSSAPPPRRRWGRGSAGCPPRRSRSARTSASRATTTTRRACWTRSSTGATSRRPTTRTGRSSTTRRSTARWTRRPGCPPARRATARGDRSTGWRPSRRPASRSYETRFRRSRPPTCAASSMATRRAGTSASRR